MNKNIEATPNTEFARSHGVSRYRLAFDRFILLTGTDRVVLLSLSARLVTLVCGPVTMLLILAHFTPEIQGYYYSFYSLLALQVFIEMGFGTVITSFASHEWAHLRIGSDGLILGPADSISRLSSLARVALRWYLVGSAILVIGLAIIGCVFFSGQVHSTVPWTSPWLALCVLSGGTLALVPIWALLEGCNQLEGVYRYRLVVRVLMNAALWIAILLGADLWTACASSAVGLLYGAWFVYRNYARFFQSLLNAPVNEVIIWKSEVWPMQWRIALSWLSGYFSFSLFTPILFHYHGAVIAGQMGLSWSLVSSLSALAGTWVAVNSPRFGVLIAKKDYASLDALHYKITVVGLLLAAVGALGIIGGLWILRSHHIWENRVLPPIPMSLFLLAAVLMQVSQPQAAYLRAHKVEPFLGLSLVSGILITISNLTLGIWFGAIGMATGYLATVALIALPFGTLIWQRNRSRWKITARAYASN